MFFIELRRLLCVLTAILLSQSTSFADEMRFIFYRGPRVLSLVSGLASLNLIVRDSELRKEIAISDEQLADIRKTLMEKQKIIVGDEAANNAAVKVYLNETLSNAQVRQLRIAVVKQRFAKASDIFDPIFLDEIGLVGNAGVDVAQKIALQLDSITKRTDKLRVAAINETLPPHAQDVVWSFFGKELSTGENEGQWDKIAVLPELGVLNQLKFAIYMPLPTRIKLSKEQQKQLKELEVDVSLKRSRQIYFSEGEISSRLDSILSGPQRFAIVQCIFQRIMRSNLLVVLHPEITKHFNFSESELSQATVELTESKKRIEELEDLELVQACNEVLKTLPLPVRTTIIDLVEGVWAFD